MGVRALGVHEPHVHLPSVSLADGAVKHPSGRQGGRDTGETVSQMVAARNRCPRLPKVRIAVALETRTGETRVALVPELVGKLTGLGYAVVVEPGAGAGALHDDGGTSQAAGAEVLEEPWLDADLVVSVNPLDVSVVRRLRAGTATVSFLPVNQSLDLVADLRDCGVTSFAMELKFGGTRGRFSQRSTPCTKRCARCMS